MASPYTTIAEYARADTEGTITLIGNRHHAGANYMNGLRSTLCNYEENGATIHYEKVETLDSDEIRALPSDFRIKYTALSALLALTQRYSQVPGGVGILETLEDHLGRWERHDASMVDLADQLSDHDVKKLQKLSDKYMMSRSRLLGSIATDRTIRSLTGIIVGYRDAIALEAVDEAVAKEPSKKLVLLWGEGHIPGLSRGLEERRYTREFTVLRDARL